VFLKKKEKRREASMEIKSQEKVSGWRRGQISSMHYKEIKSTLQNAKTCQHVPARGLTFKISSSDKKDYQL
jgi:hypothetical protein